MRLFILILSLNIVTFPVMANEDLKNDYLDSCQQKFNRSDLFCTCSYEELIHATLQKQQLEQQAENTFNQQKQRFEKTLHKNSTTLLSDHALSEEKINTICDRHDELFSYIDTLPKQARGGINTREMSKTDLQNFTVRKRDSRKVIHDLLHLYRANTKSYNLLLNDASYCGIQRDLIKIEQDFNSNSEQKNKITLADDTITALLSDGQHGHQKIVARASRMGCPQ